MLTPGMLREFIYDAVIKSHPYSGNRGVPTTENEVKIAAISGLDPNLVGRVVLDSPVKARQTFVVTTVKIETGMYLVYGGREYSIKGTQPYPMRDGSTLYHLVLEEFITR